MESSRYYSQNAERFVDQTVRIDMTSHRARFLAALPANARILDAGSGSGRDALAFVTSGYTVEAFDASPQMVAATQQLAGIPTRIMRFESFEWEGQFDGIWACASLLHVARADLALVLGKLAAALRIQGVIYASFKHGPYEREKDGRYFNDMTSDLLQSVLDATPELKQSDIWITQDQRPDRQQETWLNILLKKTD